MHEFETCVGPLDVIGVEFRRLGNIGGKWRTLTHDSDHAECCIKLCCSLGGFRHASKPACLTPIEYDTILSRLAKQVSYTMECHSVDFRGFCQYCIYVASRFLTYDAKWGLQKAFFRLQQHNIYTGNDELMLITLCTLH